MASAQSLGWPDSDGNWPMGTAGECRQWWAADVVDGGL